MVKCEIDKQPQQDAPQRALSACNVLSRLLSQIDWKEPEPELSSAAFICGDLITFYARSLRRA